MREDKRRFRVKKMFSSLLISYGTLLMVPFLVVFILVQVWDSSAEKYYKGIVNNSLTEGRMAFEKRLEVLQAGAFSMQYESELSWVCYLEGLHPGDTNITTLISCQEKLNDAFADSAKYYSYCVALDNEFVFCNRGMRVGREFFYDNYRDYENLTYEEWLEKSFQQASWSLFPMQRIKSDMGTEDAMTYSYPIRNGFEQVGTAKAVVQFLLTRQDVTEMFSSLGDIGGDVYIYGAKGELLARVGGETVCAWEDLCMDILPATGESKVIELEGVKKLVMTQQSQDGKLNFAVAVPPETVLVNLHHAKRVAWLCLISSVLLEVALGCHFAMKYSGPIKNLVENMQRMFGTEEKVSGEKKNGRISEYEFLEAGVNVLVNTNQSMQRILHEKNDREKLNFLTLLFRGEFRTTREAEEEAQYVGLELNAPGYYVLVLQTNHSMEQLSCFLRERAFSFVQASYMEDEKKIALLIGCDNSRVEQTEADREAILTDLQELGLEDVYVGIGRIYEDKSDISFSFRQACYCAEKAMRENKRKEEYCRVLLDMNMPWYPSEMEEKLINAVKCGKTEDVRKLFENLRVQNLQEVHLARVTGHMLTSNINATLLGLLSSMAEGEQITEIILRIEKEISLERALELLEEQFIGLSTRVGESRDKKTEEYYLRLKKYMEANYKDEQFSMVVAAEEFGLSESYFSIFFKEIMGKTFSAYLEGMRLERSKEMISEGKYDLEQISRIVGYNSSATFRRAFKRAFGVAPSAWKC